MATVPARRGIWASADAWVKDQGARRWRRWNRIGPDTGIHSARGAGSARLAEFRRSLLVSADLLPVQASIAGAAQGRAANLRSTRGHGAGRRKGGVLQGVYSERPAAHREPALQRHPAD